MGKRNDGQVIKRSFGFYLFYWRRNSPSSFYCRRKKKWPKNFTFGVNVGDPDVDNQNHNLGRIFVFLAQSSYVMQAFKFRVLLSLHNFCLRYFVNKLARSRSYVLSRSSHNPHQSIVECPSWRMCGRPDRP